MHPKQSSDDDDELDIEAELGIELAKTDDEAEESEEEEEVEAAAAGAGAQQDAAAAAEAAAKAQQLSKKVRGRRALELKEAALCTACAWGGRPRRPRACSTCGQLLGSPLRPPPTPLLAHTAFKPPIQPGRR